MRPSKAQKSGSISPSWRQHLGWAFFCLVAVCVAYFAGEQSRTSPPKATPVQTQVNVVRLDRESATVDREENPTVKEEARLVLNGEQARARAFDVLSEPNRVTRFRRLTELLEEVTTDNWREVLDAFVRQTGYEAGDSFRSGILR